MYKYNLQELEDYFLPESIRNLQSIAEQLNEGHNNAADIIRLKESFLSIVEFEKRRNNMPKSVSPSGLNFVFLVFERYEYILLNPYGAVRLCGDALIYEGEAEALNFVWMEEDNLLLFDFYYIVHSEIRKHICHFTRDDTAFSYSTVLRKINQGAFWTERKIIWETE